MKAILITYNQAYYDEIAATLNDNGVKGFTEWNEIKGHGSNTGEPHYGTHAWPTLNNAIISIVDDDKVDGRRQSGRHPQPTTRKRPQDPGFGAEGFQLEY